MGDSSTRTRRLVTGIWLLLVAVLVLQSLGYGIGFFLDPASGLGEFATPPPAGGDDALTVGLIGMVGVGMLGAAALFALAAFHTLRGSTAGAHLGIVLGVVYVLAGVSAFRSGWGWDAWFYTGAGLLLMMTSAAVRLLRPKEETEPPP